MNVLVTGVAGFIGCFAAKRLLAEGHTVLGLDNVNDYYDTRLKRDRLHLLADTPGFVFFEQDVADFAALARIFETRRPEYVVHLAAQAGVRYSLENPFAYIQSNIVGFFNILECCRRFPVSHLVYASSSSVYGLNTALPFAETDRADHPASLYAATKRSNELLAHSYSHLYGIPVTGLRFFTVYGPWGRPDMAPFLFARAILEGRPLKIFNHGAMRRDFTYIDDIVAGVAGIVPVIPEPNPNWESSAPLPNASSAPFAVYNIGNNRSVALESFIAVLEEAIGKKAIREYLPMQDGDVVATCASLDALQSVTAFAPSTPIEIGIPKFIAWYRQYYG